MSSSFTMLFLCMLPRLVERVPEPVRSSLPESVPNLYEVKPSRGAFPTWPQVTRQGLTVQIPSTKDLARSLKLVRLPTFIGPWRTLRGVCCGQSLQSKRCCQSLLLFVQGCAWGGDRPTRKAFLSTLPGSCQLQAACPGLSQHHVHKPYGRT